jgi:hypothetical protein
MCQQLAAELVWFQPLSMARQAESSRGERMHAFHGGSRCKLKGRSAVME